MRFLYKPRFNRFSRENFEIIIFFFYERIIIISHEQEKEYACISRYEDGSIVRKRKRIGGKWSRKMEDKGGTQFRVSPDHVALHKV